MVMGVNKLKVFLVYMNQNQWVEWGGVGECGRCRCGRGRGGRGRDTKRRSRGGSPGEVLETCIQWYPYPVAPVDQWSSAEAYYTDADTARTWNGQAQAAIPPSTVDHTNGWVGMTTAPAI